MTDGVSSSRVAYVYIQFINTSVHTDLYMLYHHLMGLCKVYKLQLFWSVWIHYNGIFILSQAAELAEFTAKIALLEDAKKKKEEEATEWQHKVHTLYTPHHWFHYVTFDQTDIIMQTLFI